MTIATIIKIIEIVVSILTAIVSVCTILTIVIKWLKNGKLKKVLELFKLIPALVKEAENMFGKGNGENKFKWVMTQLKIKALETNTKVSEEELTEQIENVVDATNNVNVDKFPFSSEKSDNEDKQSELIIETAEHNSQNFANVQINDNGGIL